MQILKNAGQKITYAFRHIFRYRLGAVYMLVGYILSFVVIFNGISIYLSAKDAMNAVEPYRYIYETELAPALNVPVSAYVEAAETLQCNVTAKDVLMFSDKEYATKCVQVVLRGSEGEQPMGCVIGNALEQYVVHQNGKSYYSLEGDLYEVSEVIDGKGSILSYRISVPYEMLKENALQAMEESFFFASVLLESNMVDTEEAKSELEAGLSDLTGSTVTMRRIPMESDGQALPQESRLGIYLCICAYVFCMVNCIIVCEFWLFQRRKEIAIRRAFHFNDRKIRNMLLFDMMCIIAVACVIYLILHAVIFSRLMAYFSVDMVLDIRSILFVLVMIPVSAAITVFPYMRRLRKKSYAAGIT